MLRPDEPAPEPPRAPPGPRPDPSPAGPAESAVFTAYQVLEQAMRRGQDAARQYTAVEGEPPMGSERNGQDPRDPYTQAFRAWTTLLSTWTDFLGPLFPAGMRPPWAPAAPPAETAPAGAPGQGLRLVLDTMSARPVEVELELEPAAPGEELAVQDLRAFEEGQPPITGARLERLDGGRLKLHLRVPPEQPGGVYAGVVYDPRRSERRGSLTVRVPA